MIKRQVQQKLYEQAQSYPIVSVLGPRQSGKTTLCKSTFSSYQYCNLEDPILRAFAQEDPRAFFKKYDKNIILDEIQNVPSLTSFLQVLVDESGLKGQFILTGSHQPKLKEGISQSLAGRTSLLTLWPLSLEELDFKSHDMDYDDILYRGFYPGLYQQQKLNPTEFYSNYYQTYVERDVRSLIQVKSQNSFERFLKVLAGRAGQLVNMSAVSNEIGVSSTTLSQWLSVLEASFICFQLKPYYKNYGKTITKSSKIYFTDVGLLSYLLGIENKKQISRDPLRGSLFENLVVAEAFKQKFSRLKDPNMYYLRTDKGKEVDLILKNKEGHLVPIEIKSSMTFHRNFTKSLSYAQKLSPDFKKGLVVYAGQGNHESEAYKLCPFSEFRVSDLY